MANKLVLTVVLETTTSRLRGERSNRLSYVSVASPAGFEPARVGLGGQRPSTGEDLVNLGNDAFDVAAI